ncbi:MAG TPA: hypothetical protein VG125_04565 [Pirellulales bacterium]|nr:hypothetical protein [Pirellulales bacterium]
MASPNTAEAIAPQRLVLLPVESDVYFMEFSKRLVPASGSQAAETISSVVSATSSPAGLTIGSPTISGTQVLLPISNPTPGVTYLVKVVILTSLSRMKQGLGWLIVPTVPS